MANCECHNQRIPSLLPWRPDAMRTRAVGARGCAASTVFAARRRIRAAHAAHAAHEGSAGCRQAAGPAWRFGWLPSGYFPNRASHDIDGPNRNRWFTVLKNGGSFHGELLNYQMVIPLKMMNHDNTLPWTPVILNAIRSHWVLLIGQWRAICLSFFWFSSLALRHLWLLWLYHALPCFTYLSSYLSIYLSIHLFIYPSNDLSIHLSIDLSIYRSIDLSIYLSIYLYAFSRGVLRTARVLHHDFKKVAPNF